MKISEAIRKGAKMGPQMFGAWGDRNGGSCVMGAVLLGTGIYPAQLLASNAPLNVNEVLKACFDAQFSHYYECPVLGCSGTANLSYILMHLNDAHNWTRERIAGWVEAHIETPTYSMLEMQEFMQVQIPAKAEALCVR